MRLMALVRRSEVPFNALRQGKRVVAPLTKIALAALLAMPCVAQAQETGNVEAGHAYAKKVCAECHAVERGENDYLNPPSFQMVAEFSRHHGAGTRSLATKPASQHAEFHPPASRHGKRDCVHHEPQIDLPLRRRGVSSREHLLSPSVSEGGSMEYATFRKWLPEHGCRLTRSAKSAEKVTER